MNISTSLQIYTVRDVIDTLRPELKRRDQLRDMLMSFWQNPIQTNTYFRTIPVDICKIIAEFLPSLRVTDLQPYFDRANEIKQQFTKKYTVREDQTDSSANPAGIVVGEMDVYKIIEDYPEFKQNPYHIMFGKYIDGTLHVKITEVYDKWEYVGGGYIKHERAISKSDTVNATTEFEDDFRIRRVLPCGLAVVTVDDWYYVPNNGKEYYLVDFAEPARVWLQVDIKNIPTGGYINDLGEWVMSECSNAKLSELYGKFVKIFP